MVISLSRKSSCSSGLTIGATQSRRAVRVKVSQNAVDGKKRHATTLADTALKLRALLTPLGHTNFP